jgi:hypothetical protein
MVVAWGLSCNECGCDWLGSCRVIVGKLAKPSLSLTNSVSESAPCTPATAAATMVPVPSVGEFLVILLSCKRSGAEYSNASSQREEVQQHGNLLLID